MDNETKLSAEQINSIKKELEEGNERINVTEFMQKHLNSSQIQALSSFMSDPEKMKNLMESPIAKRFMEKFRKEEKE